MSEKENFLFPRYRYLGEFEPSAVIFDANLQEFAQKVTYLCTLENSGKLSQGQAYREIKNLWKQLRQSKRALGIETNPESGNSNEEHKKE
ncbi:MAG: hypothetical protein ACLFPV_10535 [Spirochaetaceae bacterium]